MLFGKAWRSSSLGGQPDLLQPCRLCPSRLQPPSQRGLETQAVSAQLCPPTCSGGEGANPGAAARAPRAEAGNVLWGTSADLLQVQRSGSVLLWAASPCSTSHPSSWSQVEAEALLVIAFFPHPWVKPRVNMVLWRDVRTSHSSPLLKGKQPPQRSCSDKEAMSRHRLDKQLKHKTRN